MNRPTAPSAPRSPLLEARDLTVRIRTDGGELVPVRNVSFSLEEGKTLGVVGESGSGKSTLALALSGLASPGSDVRIDGEVCFDGRDLLTLAPDELRNTRGRKIGYVFQNPEDALNPSQTIGSQLTDVIRAHRPLPDAEFKASAVSLLQRVGIEDPHRAISFYPHQFSGGMNQRVVIAMALANRPALLIADEPTSALDVLVQEQIIDLLNELRNSLSMSLIIISHDLRVVSRLADELLVMYGGRVAEIGPADAVLGSPRHWYTVGLLDCVPDARRDYGPEARLAVIPGNPIGPEVTVPGCPFADRCHKARDLCRETLPSLTAGSGDGGHQAACWFPSPEGQPKAVSSMQGEVM